MDPGQSTAAIATKSTGPPGQTGQPEDINDLIIH
jgi:hypothetical protein